MKKAFLIIMVITILLNSFSLAMADERPLTRGGATQMLFDVFSQQSQYNQTHFTDLTGKSYAQAVIWAETFGFVQGTGDETFDGDRTITRAEAAMLIFRYSSEHSSTDISLYADFNDVPEWAIEPIAFAIASGLLMTEAQLLNPFGEVTESEFSAILKGLYTQALDAANLLAHPEKIDYTGLTARNPDKEAELYLGMSTDELAGVLGRPIENDFGNLVDGILITCLNNSAAAIGIPGMLDSPWKINGISVNDTREDIEQIIGQPDYFAAKGSALGGVLPLSDTATYFYDSKGKSNDIKEEAAYFLIIGYNEDGSIRSLEITTVASTDGSVISYPVKGVVNIYEKGDGNAIIKNDIPVNLCLDIEYKGTGSFSINTGSGEVFSRTGPYSGTILLRDVQNSAFEVRADGEWTVVGKYSLNPSIKYSASGSGDYVRQLLAYGKYRVSHDGDGPFSVMLVSSSNNMPFEDVAVIDTVGKYSETIELDGSIFTAYLEIITDGNWIVEPIFEFSVLPIPWLQTCWNATF